jgi:hypothetical protein
MSHENGNDRGPMSRANPERRTHNRLLCSELVAVLWQNRRGRHGESVGVLEDYSGSGANLFMQDSLDIGDAVRVSAGRFEFAATVRSCSSAPTGFFVGLQFEEPLPDGCFTPEHLLDLSQFDSERGNAAAGPAT